MDKTRATIKQAEATIREALTEGAIQLALLAKHPSQNPWIKQLKEAVIALDTLMTAQGEMREALIAYRLCCTDPLTANEIMADSLGKSSLSRWGEEP